MRHACFDERVGHDFVATFFVKSCGGKFCAQFDGVAASASTIGFDLFKGGFPKPAPSVFFEDAESLDAGDVFRRVRAAKRAGIFSVAADEEVFARSVQAIERVNFDFFWYAFFDGKNFFTDAQASGERVRVLCEDKFDERHCFFLLPPHKSQRVYWTALHAFKAENAFRAVFSLARIVRYVNVHRADFFARATFYAFFCVAFYAEQRKITCGF